MVQCTSMIRQDFGPDVGFGACLDIDLGFRGHTTTIKLACPGDGEQSFDEWSIVFGRFIGGSGGLKTSSVVSSFLPSLPMSSRTKNGDRFRGPAGGGGRRSAPPGTEFEKVTRHSEWFVAAVDSKAPAGDGWQQRRRVKPKLPGPTRASKVRMWDDVYTVQQERVGSSVEFGEGRGGEDAGGVGGEEGGDANEKVIRDRCLKLKRDMGGALAKAQRIYKGITGEDERVPAVEGDRGGDDGKGQDLVNAMGSGAVSSFLDGGEAGGGNTNATEEEEEEEDGGEGKRIVEGEIRRLGAQWSENGLTKWLSGETQT
jgi:hypothetical protein